MCWLPSAGMEELRNTAGLCQALSRIAVKAECGGCRRPSDRAGLHTRLKEGNGGMVYLREIWRAKPLP